MVWWLILALVCLVPAADMAYGQFSNMTQFFILTELGNVFPVVGPPPERPPGFDSAPRLDNHVIDTSVSISSGGGRDSIGSHTFGQAGAYISLPTGSNFLSTSLILDWKTDRWGATSQPLYAPYPVGELHTTSSHDGNKLYLGPGIPASGSVDILQWCNNSTVGMSCVNNQRGMNSTIVSRHDHGLMLQLPANGRTIINFGNLVGFVGSNPMEVFFTCPHCTDEAAAYWGVTNTAFMERGFQFTGNVVNYPPSEAYVPTQFVPGSLRGLAWDSYTDVNGAHGPPGVTYWKDGGSCANAPNLSVSSGANQIYLDDFNTCSTGMVNFQIGTARTTVSKPLTPGWNSVPYPALAFIVVISPGSDAYLQIRNGSSDCCTGFDDGIVNRVGDHGTAAVLHSRDRHLTLLPYNLHVPGSNPELQNMRIFQDEADNIPQFNPRWLSHSEPGDPIYHGMFYDGYLWPPYYVRMVDVNTVRFEKPEIDTIARDLSYSDYTSSDMAEITQMRNLIPRLDAGIYDALHGKMLTADEGTFVLWDGTRVERPYVQPWLGIHKSPVWETFGVPMEEDTLAMVERYVTIPVVKPIRLSETYLSSIPCGHPGRDAANMLWDAMVEGHTAGRYDVHLVNFLVHTDHDGPVDDNMRLQQIYLASRTYIDYADGEYDSGDSVSIPVLPNRPYLCTTISPNILESQFLVYALPSGGSYISLGGTEGAVFVQNMTTDDAGYERTIGVQSPRNGVVAMDVTARFGAAVSVFGIGEVRGAPPYSIPTGNWLNGTMQVKAELTVGEKPGVSGANNVTLAEFDIDTYDIYDEAYGSKQILPLTAQCYGRFTTMPDDSPYIVKTLTHTAELGEHIPVTLRLTATASPAVSSGPFSYGSALPIVVFDGTTVTESATVTESGPITGASLTLDWFDVYGYESLAIYGGGAFNGGTLVSVTAPSGTTHTLAPHTTYHTTGNPFDYTFDLGFLAGEDMNGVWTVTLHDQGDLGGGTVTDRRNNVLNSWELVFTGQGAGMSTSDICDGTTAESAIVQYILRTFAIDVR